MSPFGRTWLWSVFCLLVCAACSDDDTSGGGCGIEDTDGGRVLRCDDGSEVILSDLPGVDGENCTVVAVDEGAEIRCPDGSTVTVPYGTPGPAGDAGPGGPGPRPSGTGLALTLSDAEVDDDGRVTVTLELADRDGVPLDRLGQTTEGGIEPSFTLAALRSDGSGFDSYLLAEQESAITEASALQPTSDEEGTWLDDDPAAGLYRYRFSEPLPEDFDPEQTHRIAAWATRTVAGVRYASDAFLDFRPDGSDDLDRRDIAPTETCNRCHNPLALHGSQRLSMELCVTCHTPQGTDPDTGNTIDMRVMAHKIHMGEQLPSVQAGTPYQIIGYRDSVHDYSEVVFPHEVHNCASCHTGADGDLWAENPTIEACGSCHDDVDFGLPTPDPDPDDDLIPHPGGARENGSCATCHAPQPDGLPGLSVEESHQVGRLNPNTPELVVDILDLREIGPTNNLVVDFQVQVDGAGWDVVNEPLETLNFVLAGPAAGITGERSFAPEPADFAVVDAAAGSYSYTLPETLETAASLLDPVPAPAQGSFALMIEGRHTFVVDRPDGTTEEVRVGVENPVQYFAITGDLAPRRTVVTDEKCNACHRDMSFHGDNRARVDACVLCHNANFDTLGRMPTPEVGTTAAATSVRFGPMIHRIHGHEVASGPYVLYGFDGSPLDFSEVLFPGAAQDCESCHVEGSYDLPLPESLPPSVTRIKNDQGLSAGPAASVPVTAANCSGCHDSSAAFAHASLMTTEQGVESCATCHASGHSSGVDSVHARPEWE